LAKRSDIEAWLRRLAPRMPEHEFGAVVDHAIDSQGLSAASAETAAWLSLIAYARHALTDYDDLLKQVTIATAPDTLSPRRSTPSWPAGGWRAACDRRTD
jgi:hypothetical protein